MTRIDWIVVIIYFIGIAALGFSLTRRGSKNIGAFFTGGRSLPWWLAGGSLIATSFGSGTPMWVTGIVRRFGIQSVWLYWTHFIGVGLAVFVFARYWRRIKVVTDLEMMKIRYGERAAVKLRVAYSLYQTVGGFLFFASAIIGGRLLFSSLLGISQDQAFWWVVGAASLTVVYSASSGLLGVAWTDLVQLVVSIFGVSVLAGLVIFELGGIGPMVEKLSALDSWTGNSLSIVPEVGSVNLTQFGALSMWNAIAFFGILWWALAVSNSYIAQRLYSCRSEKDASKAMLFYGIVYWGFLAWPWIIVALGSLLLLDPDSLTASQEDAYPKMIVAFSPVVIRGLLMSSMLAAAMSTISTFVNIKAAYFVNDLYKLVLVKNASDRHYVWVSRISVVVMFIIGLLCASFFNSILELGYLQVMLGTAACMLLLFRWQWGRFNMHGEITGLVTVVVVSVLTVGFGVLDGPVQALLPLKDHTGELQTFSESFDYYGLRVMLVLGITALAAITATLLSRPVEGKVLEGFLSKVRPNKTGWKGTLRRIGFDYTPAESTGVVLAGPLLVVGCILSVLVGLGSLLLGRWIRGGVLIIVFGVTLFLALRMIASLAPAPDDPEDGD